VGPGGSPDENGETTLDALIMNGVMKFLPLCFRIPHSTQFNVKTTIFFNLFQFAAKKDMFYYVTFSFCVRHTRAEGLIRKKKDASLVFGFTGMPKLILTSILNITSKILN
jgi:hypothetical protein